MDPIKQHGAFSWNELTTPDPKAALEFYTKLFGWTTEVMQMPGFEYNIVKAGGQAIGGVMTLPKEGCPTMWSAYVTVDNIDETAKLAEALGGKIIMPPTDIPEVGRFAIFCDPQGALISAISYLPR
jgi:uncharacterized protein